MSLEDAEKRIAEGDFLGGARILEEAIGQNPSLMPQLAPKLASLYLLAGETKRGMELGERALRELRGKDRNKFMCFWGPTLAFSGKLERAKNAFRELEASREPEAAFARGVMLMIWGRTNEALTVFESLISSQEPMVREMSLFNSAVCCALADNPDRAIDFLSALSAESGVHPHYKSHRAYIRGLLALLRGSTRETREHMREALAGYRGLGSLGNLAEVLKDMSISLFLDGSPGFEVYVNVAIDIFTRLGHKGPALEAAAWRGLMGRGKGPEELLREAEAGGFAVAQALCLWWLGERERAEELAREMGFRALLRLAEALLLPRRGRFGRGPKIRLMLLGKPKARFGEREVDLDDKPGAVLVFSLLNRGAPKGRALTEFWPDKPTRRALRNLYGALSVARRRLREGLGVPIPPVRPRGTLDPGVDFTSDVEEFEELIGAARALGRTHQVQEAGSLYRRALELYGGDFMEGCKAYWCEETRERLRAMATEAAVFLSGGADDPEEAMGWARRALGLDPLSEAGARALISALRRAGRVKEASRFLERFRRRYKKVVGEEPSL